MASASAQRLAAIYTAQQLQAANAQNTQTLNQGYGQGETDLVGNTGSALTALGTGVANAVPQYEAASAKYQPWADAGLSALGTYQNSLGLNGASGNAAATAAFQASPGYEYQVGQATDQVARKASALGALGSGNTMAAISDRAQNIANQDYGSWQGQLNGLSNTGLQATGAQAGLTKGIGDLYAAQGVGSASLYQGLGQGLAGMESTHANALANSNLAAATGSGAAVTGAAQATDAARNANSNLMLGLAGLGLKAGTSIFSAFS